jgi:hypothetical protein
MISKLKIANSVIEEALRQSPGSSFGKKRHLTEKMRWLLENHHIYSNKNQKKINISVDAITKFELCAKRTRKTLTLTNLENDKEPKIR